MARPFLLRNKWLAGHAIILILIVAFFMLMQWQLDRLDQRRERNREIHASMNATPHTQVTNDTPNWQRLRLTGIWDAQGTKLLRYPIHNGQPGYEIVTPLVMDGTRIPVVRGWIPIDVGKSLTVDDVAPEGQITIDAWLRHADRGSVKETPSPESQTAFPTIAKVKEPYAQILPNHPSGDISKGNTTITPVTRDGPDTSEGPHFSYALQWISFVVIAIGGWSALLYRVWRDEKWSDEGI